MRPPSFSLLFLACAVAVTPPLAAQDVAALRSAVTATAHGTTVRVELPNGQLESGPLAGHDSVALLLGESGSTPARIEFAAVRRYWVRGRSVGSGAIVGGVAGAAVGGALGALLGGWCGDTGCGPGVAQGAAIGVLLLGSAGAATGAIIGAAVPRWRLRWALAKPLSAVPAAAVAPQQPLPAAPAAEVAPQQPPERLAAQPRPSRRMGEISLQLVGGHGGIPGSGSGLSSIPDREGTGVGRSASLAFRLGRFALGPEAALVEITPRVVVLGGVARMNLPLGTAFPLVPYVVLGAGDYIWESHTAYLSGSLGAGLSVGRRSQWRLEARWHRTIQNTGSDPKPWLLSLGVGPVLSW